MIGNRAPVKCCLLVQTYRELEGTQGPHSTLTMVEPTGAEERAALEEVWKEGGGGFF